MSKILSIIPPKESRHFEEACLHLWREILGDPNIKFISTHGGKQYGVDLCGYRNRDPERIVGIQCKVRSGGRKLTQDDIKKEIEKAKGFEPKLSEYYILTTAKPDVKTQMFVNKLAQELKKENSFLFDLWAWDRIEFAISDYPETAKKFDPNYNISLESVADDLNAEIKKVPNEVNMHTDTVMDEQKSFMNARFDKIGGQLEALTLRSAIVTNAATDVIQNQNAYEKVYDEQINHLKDEIINGEVKVALKKLVIIQKNVDKKQEPLARIKFRLCSNIANCHMLLGDDEKAIKLFKKAYEYAPQEPAAIANIALSMLINKEHKKVISFARKEIEKDPTNESLAGYLIQAMRHDASFTDPYVYIPEQIRNTYSVKIAAIYFFQFKGNHKLSKSLIDELYKEYPEKDDAVQLYAESEMREVLKEDNVFVDSYSYAPEDFKRLSDSCKKLHKLWEKILNSGRKLLENNITICSNLILCYLILQQCKKATSAAIKSLEVAPDDKNIIFYSAITAVECGNNELAEKTLHKIKKEPDATILKCRHYAQFGRWSDIVKIEYEKFEKLPEDRSFFLFLREIAVIKAGDSNDPKGDLEKLIDEYKNESRPQIICARYARKIARLELAKVAYQNALTALKKRDSMADRLMVSAYAVQHESMTDVVMLLEGKISNHINSEPLKNLAFGHAYSIPITESAVKFFENLPEKIKKLIQYRWAQAAMHFNQGALQEAENIFLEIYSKENDLTSFLSLVRIYYKSGKQKDIPSLLARINLNKLHGTQFEKMELSHVLMQYNREQDSLHLAYKTLNKSFGKPEIAKMYWGLFMSRNSLISKIIATDTVAIDTWVMIQNEHGETNSFIIENDNSSSGDTVLSPDEDTSRECMNKSVGDSFKSDSRWTIMDIKHKYLHSLYKVHQNFDYRYSEDKSLQKIRIKDGDLEPILKQVRERSKYIESIVEAYKKHVMPLNLLAKKFGMNSIELADSIRAKGEKITVCSGVFKEVDLALETLEKATNNKKSSAILDAYTAWTIANFGAFDVVKDIFRNIYIPQSALDEIGIIFDKLNHDLGETMTMGYKDGQYYKQVMSADDISSNAKIVEEILSDIRKNCNVRPVAVPDSKSVKYEKLFDSFGHDVLDCAFISDENSIFITEDFNYRRFLKTEFGLQGCWLQPIFIYLYNNKIINDERYVDLLLKLASINHAPFINEIVLFTAFAQDKTKNMDKFRTISRCLGGEHANMSLHANVASKFLQAIWNGAEENQEKIEKCTDIILHSLTDKRGQDWQSALAIVSLVSENIQSYIEKWIENNSLPLDRYNKAVREIRNMIK